MTIAMRWVIFVPAVGRYVLYNIGTYLTIHNIQRNSSTIRENVHKNIDMQAAVVHTDDITEDESFACLNSTILFK